jgi:hypothetical protein
MNTAKCIICEKKKYCFDCLYFCKQCYKNIKGEKNEKIKNKKQNITNNG